MSLMPVRLFTDVTSDSTVRTSVRLYADREVEITYTFADAGHYDRAVLFAERLARPFGSADDAIVALDEALHAAVAGRTLRAAGVLPFCAGLICLERRAAAAATVDEAGAGAQHLSHPPACNCKASDCNAPT